MALWHSIWLVVRAWRMWSYLVNNSPAQRSQCRKISSDYRDTNLDSRPERDFNSTVKEIRAFEILHVWHAHDSSIACSGYSSVKHPPVTNTIWQTYMQAIPSNGLISSFSRISIFSLHTRILTISAKVISVNDATVPYVYVIPIITSISTQVPSAPANLVQKNSTGWHWNAARKKKEKPTMAVSIVTTYMAIRWNVIVDVKRKKKNPADILARVMVQAKARKQRYQHYQV